MYAVQNCKPPSDEEPELDKECNPGPVKLRVWLERTVLT